MNAAVGKSRCKHLGLPRCSRKSQMTQIEIDLDLNELDATSAEPKATYQEIKDYVLKEFGIGRFQILYFSNQKEMWNRSRREL